MPTPKSIALRRLAGTVRIPGLSGGQIAALRSDIREKSIVSAGVECARYLNQIRSTTIDVVRGDMTPEQARAALRAWLDKTGYEPDPEKRGTIQDLGSDARLRVTVDTNVKLAQGYGRYRWQVMNAKLFPYTELYRREQRKQPRNWPVIWRKAGGKMHGGRFVAPVNSPVWLRISDFGHPYPVFKWLSGMWTRMISQPVATRLGLPTVAGAVVPRKMTSGTSIPLKRIDRGLARILGSLLPGWRLDRDANLRRSS